VSGWVIPSGRIHDAIGQVAIVDSGTLGRTDSSCRQSLNLQPVPERLELGRLIGTRVNAGKGQTGFKGRIHVKLEGLVLVVVVGDLIGGCNYDVPAWRLPFGIRADPLALGHRVVDDLAIRRTHGFEHDFAALA
jgi:hypothetical protein